MNKPIVLGGRTFTTEFIEQLRLLQRQEAVPSNAELARVVCQRLAWYSPDGRPALSSARVALNKLRQRGLLDRSGQARGPSHRHRLEPSGQPLPAVVGVPARVDRVEGLHLYLLSGSKDPLHGLWNDLMIQQHPSPGATRRIDLPRRHRGNTLECNPH